MIGTSNSKYISPHLVARHIPQSVSDLAVNVKKVEEVRHWLRDRLGKRGLLVLTGPAGDLLLLTFGSWVLLCLSDCMSLSLRMLIIPFYYF